MAKQEGQLFASECPKCAHLSAPKPQEEFYLFANSAPEERQQQQQHEESGAHLGQTRRGHRRQSSYEPLRQWLLAGASTQLKLCLQLSLALLLLLSLLAQHSLCQPVEAATTSGPASNGSTLVINVARSGGRGRRSASLEEVDALRYLQRYGYMNDSQAAPSSSQLISEQSFHEAVVAFQRFAGLPESGSMDAQTVRYMQMPRCGNKDLGRAAESGKRRRRRRRRRRRYALQGSKWRRQELSYRISQYPSRFAHKRHEVDAQIERAFALWSQVAPIEFVVKREGRVHIDIRFASGEHGDGDPFDGPGNTLAHAYFPQYGGDAHFDDQEYWTVDSYAGTNIFQVAAHELGHSLGLGHSSVREALMAPFYQKYKPNFKLHADDVLAIQALYGERDSADSPGSGSTATPASSTSSTTPASEPDQRPQSPGKPVDLCQDSRVDAITRTEDGNTYVFRGNHYWQVKNEGLARGPPGKIARDWDGLPGDLDAALTWSDGKTFFFKGDKYWRFLNKRREPGYPKPISLGFAGVPSNLDAAFVWSGNGKTYFFKRDKYWRFDSKQEPPVSSQYPKALKNWVGLPAGPIDAAFKWDNGMTYFFKNDLYYRFDDRQFEVDTSARPAFPRSTAEWWFGCTNSNLPIVRRPAASDGEPELAEQASSSVGATESSLLFHRKPNLNYQEPGQQAGGVAQRPKPAGSSLARSILTSPSALFPSSSSSSSSASSCITVETELDRSLLVCRCRLVVSALVMPESGLDSELASLSAVSGSLLRTLTTLCGRGCILPSSTVRVSGSKPSASRGMV